ncbi:MAG: molybdenum ABC transporter ATP-binding protein [Acidobacteriia bacterium]|nr:molybdenum ABC transporter ATP-binding protein [Terriglobia bacterium]
MSSAALSARVRRAQRRRGANPFVLEVSLRIEPGFTILFGPSGAGKSTLLDCIAGLARPDQGRIAAGDLLLFDSETRTNLPPQQRQLAYVFQTLALFPHLTVEENAGYGLAHLPEEQRRARVGEILESFRVAGLAAHKPGEISGGERQRVALARSLVTSPRVLLLDEPLSALDAAVKAEILADLRAWNAQRRLPILYVTHNREEVDVLGERMIVLEEGRVVAQGPPREVLEAPRRKRLAQAAGFENFLAATVLDLRETDGVMRVRLEGTAVEFEVPLAHATPGDRVQLAIRAGDILLATQRPAGLSARNVLPGRIAALEERGALVRVQVDCGARFLVHVTPGAVRSLRLAVELPVWVVVKTHSCHLVEE